MGAGSEPTYAVQVVRPFWKLLRSYPQIPVALIEQAESGGPDQRVPVAAGQALLQAAVDVTGEPNLGLLAARATELGSFEVLEYVAVSAPTWRAALETAFRYSHVMNEAADFRLEIVDDKAHIVLHSSVKLTRAGVDYQSAAFHVSASRWLVLSPELEVWFRHEEPSDISEYLKTFGAAKLVFGAAHDGFVYDAARLDTPMKSADPSLHDVLRKHADRLLAQLAPGDGLVAHVRAQLLASLAHGPIAAVDLAEQLGVTRRTLTRRLGQHGTSFSALLEEVRREAAVHYLESSDHSVEDIAFLLGFSESSAFVRAFKRWHGVAPMAFRRARRAR